MTRAYRHKSVLCVFIMAVICACTEAKNSEVIAQASTKTDPSTSSPRPQPLGTDIVGQPAPAWQLVEWGNSTSKTLEDLRGQVVFVRFWTDSCPYCEKTMPAIQELADEFRDRPVFFLGLYHSKPFGSERPWKSATSLAQTWGVSFPIAYDREWKTLRSWWLDGARRSATSASFVIGADGRFVYTHPGPVFHPSDDPREVAQDRDYQDVRAAIRRALDAREKAKL